MDENNRLSEAEKQLRIFLENDGVGPYSEELKRITERVGEIREAIGDS